MATNIPAPQSGGEVPSSAFHMNNEDFILLPAPQKNTKCGSCGDDILWKTTDRDVFKHFERYLYPSETGPHKQWKQIKVSKTRMRPVYYHATPQCIYRRFPKAYFDKVTIQIEKSVNIDRLHGFTHPLLNSEGRP